MATGLHVAGGLPAQRVGRFILRRWLAQGGMAELFLATPAEPSTVPGAHPSQIVVVKRVLSQFAQDPQFVRMFAREAQLASALKHPNIVEVYESHAEGSDECFFAMEYVHGPDLAEVLRTLKDTGGAVPLSHALTLAAGICAGLEHAHEQRDDTGQALGIVHRDVSPSNVMIAHDGTIKIMDFGVAKALALTSFTQAGTRKGKLSYMSPEQAVADPVDRRTDVFAIGAVLFELTTMQRMLGGDNELAVMHKLLFRERPKPSELKPGYPIELEKIVLKAVAQSPKDRFQTAGAMQQAIEDFARRNNIRLSATALAQWVATVIPPKQHPSTDPEFFAAVPILGGTFSREATVAEGIGGHTLAGRGAHDHPTSLDGPGRVWPTDQPATAVGHLVANDQASAVVQYVPVAPSAQVIVNPDVLVPSSAPVLVPVPARPIGVVTAIPGSRTGVPATAHKSGSYPKASTRNNAGAGVIIVIAGFIAASAVVAALWYTRSGSSSPETISAPARPVEVGAPVVDAKPAVEQKLEPIPIAPEPTDDSSPPTPTPTPTPSPDPTQNPTPTVEGTTPPVAPEAADPTAKKKPRDREKDKDRGKKKVEDKPPVETKATPPTTEKKPPPPPPPPPRGKDRPPTDTLLPPGG